MSFKRFSQLSKKRKKKILQQNRFAGMKRADVRRSYNQAKRKKNRAKLAANNSKNNNKNNKTKLDTTDLLTKLIDGFQPTNQRSEPKDIDYGRIAENIPQIDYESLQPDAPSFAKNVATAISGSSAGGIRRRRSKRSQLGMNAMGTGQLKRRPQNKLSLGGLNI